MTNAYVPILCEDKCNICGNTKFIPGFNKRTVNGRNPRCSRCGSMERHRLIRKVYECIGKDTFKDFSCIQFSSDPAVPRDYFNNFTISEYGGQNSQDISSLTFPDNSFDLIICNHVLEHIEKDVKAIHELVRISTKEGIVQISFPMPHFIIQTIDWGYPKIEDHGHFRYYGGDVINRLLFKSGANSCLCIVSFDTVTGAWEFVYFLSKNYLVLSGIGDVINKKMPCFIFNLNGQCY